jgi:hypothetical protein
MSPPDPDRDIIDTLVGDLVVQQRLSLGRRLAAGVLGGVVAAATVMLAWLGVNPHMPTMMLSGMFWMKMAYGAALGLAGLMAAARLARPDGHWGRWPWLALGAILLLLGVGAWRLWTAPMPMRGHMVMGESALVCPWLIALLSVPVAAGLVWALRGMAPVRLRRAGAAIGLAAGGIATMVYAVHCPESAVPFIAIWYTLGMALAATAGWLLGPRLLRW